MKFKITSEPTHCNGIPFDERDDLKIGDVVHLTGTTPDPEGDVFFSPSVNGRDHIALSCLTPVVEFVPGEVVQISAVRAALVALGIEADVVAVAQAIEAAAKAAE